MWRPSCRLCPYTNIGKGTVVKSAKFSSTGKDLETFYISIAFHYILYTIYEGKWKVCIKIRNPMGINGFCINTRNPMGINGFCINTINPMGINGFCINTRNLMGINGFCINTRNPIGINRFYINTRNPMGINGFCIYTRNPMGIKEFCINTGLSIAWIVWWKDEGDPLRTVAVRAISNFLPLLSGF